MKKLKLLLILLLFNFSPLLSQTTYAVKKHEINKSKTIITNEIKHGFNANLKHVEAPLPDGSSMKSYIARQKEKSKAYWQTNKISPTKINAKTSQPPSVSNKFVPERELINGNKIPVYAGIPSDNTLAVSNDGIALMAMNSVIYAHDLKGDTAYLEQQIIFLRDLVGGIETSSYYDPKLHYDPEMDRFIIALLKDNTPTNSEVIICFSSSNNPNDPWHVYNLPGNPLDNNRWTDFPAVAITADKLYFTANLIIPQVSWQIGFDGSIIWEMDKIKGFEGEQNIDATLYHDIKFEDKFLRNLHTVQGSDGTSNRMTLLSNRNFDIVNDTIFMLSLEQGEIEINALKLNHPYGMPPNARQFDTDTTDPTNGLQTNDARVLGAIQFDDEIQFVGNTVDPVTGNAAIYHGHIYDYENEKIATLHIIKDSIKDFGYPNIAWSGNEKCDRETIIAFNHSYFDIFPGNSTIHYTNEGTYSSIKVIEDGLNYVNRLQGGYERWGDYYGLQRLYYAPGKVASFGYYPLINNSNSGLFAILESPDTSEMIVSPNFISGNDICKWTVNIDMIGGTPPFQYFWDNSTTPGEQSMANLCAGTVIKLKVVDQRNCSIESDIKIPYTPTPSNNEAKLFPNPVKDYVAVQFTLSNEANQITAIIYDNAGRKIHELGDFSGKEGINEFSFSMAPLSQGKYQLMLFHGDEVIVNKPFIVAH